MATLELVRLRSKFPPSGHITVRHPAHVINPAAPLDLIAEDLHEILDSLQTSTTPQVAAPAPGDGETPARKGGQAR